MREGPKNNGQGQNRIFSQFVAEKKKAVMALCLIALMAFMWLRVLTNKAKQGVAATMMTEQTSDSVSESQFKVSFIELPETRGRNDVLTRDFFAVGSWQDFLSGRKGSGGGGEVSIVSGDVSEEVIRGIADKLKLEAIELGETPQAFINDKLLTVGDKVIVIDGINKYECEVTGIEKNKVLVRCGEAEITLKLSQAVETAD